MDDTSRSLQARVAAILFFLHVQSRKIQEIPQSCKGLLSTIPLQRCLVYTGRMSSTFTIRDIVNEDATASVSDYGAHVLSWTPAGEQAVVWRPKAIHLKEGTAIRGGVPIIFPWFNSGFEGGHVASKKPKHGFARNSFWHYDKEGSSDALLRYTLDSSEINADILSQFVSGPNPQFHAVYTIEVGCELTMSLTVYNDGDEPLSYEEALHTYLQVGDAEQSQVCGLEGADYLDTVLDGDPRCSQGNEPVTFQGMVDRIYYSADTLELRDPCCSAPSLSPSRAQRRPWYGIRENKPETPSAIWMRANGAASSAWKRSTIAIARSSFPRMNHIFCSRRCR